jgi:energy-coupling factor transport system ATP-binding protein
MLTNPDVLLLDEPTKGLDYFAKNEIGNLLQKTLSGGVTIIMVTHDVDFAAGYADRCGLLFDGSVTVENDSNSFFANNKFYTTLASRMSRGVFKNAVTTEEVIECIRAGETDET